MAYTKPPVINAGVVNADAQFNTHPDLHNELADAINQLAIAVDAIANLPHSTFTGTSITVPKNSSVKSNQNIAVNNGVNGSSGSILIPEDGLYMVTSEGTWTAKTPAESPSMYIPKVQRVYDSNTYSVKLDGSTVRSIPLGTLHRNASAVVLTVVLDLPTENGYVTLWSGDKSVKPVDQSNGNYTKGTTDNSTTSIVPIISGTTINFVGTTLDPNAVCRLVVDMNGIFVAEAGSYGERGMKAMVASTVLAQQSSAAIPELETGSSLSFMHRFKLGDRLDILGEFSSIPALTETHDERLTGIKTQIARIAD